MNWQLDGPILGLALMFFTISGCWLAALSRPTFGKWWLGSGWPPLFSDSQHHRSAQLRVRFIAGAYFALGSGCGSVVLLRLLNTSNELRLVVFGVIICSSLGCLWCAIRQNSIVFRK